MVETHLEVRETKDFTRVNSSLLDFLRPNREHSAYLEQWTRSFEPQNRVTKEFKLRMLTEAPKGGNKANNLFKTYRMYCLGN